MLLIVLLALVNAFSLALFFLTGLDYEVLGLVKPITVWQYSGFLLFAAVLHKARPWFNSISEIILNALIVLGFFAIMATGFEALWSFSYWFASYIKSQVATTAGLDQLTYQPIKNLLADRIGLNPSAKKNFLFLLMSIYFTYFVHRIQSRRDHHAKT